MKKSRIYIISAFYVLVLISLCGCDEIQGIFTRNAAKGEQAEYTSSIDNSHIDENPDSLAKARADSIERVQKDSIAKIEAAFKAQEMENIISNQSNSINGLNSRVANLENNAKYMLDKTSAYTFMIVEFIILALIIYLLYSKIRKIEKRVRKIKNTVEILSNPDNELSKRDVLIMINNGLQNLAEKTTKYNAQQDWRMDEIVKRIIKLENVLENNTNRKPQTTTNAPENRERQASNVFYMPRTIQQMQFDDSKKKYYKDESVFFKFTIKNSGNAEFIFDPYDESHIVRAYDDRDNSLLTVCELESRNATPTTFRNIEPGKAELREGIWVVTKKLKLQYV